MRFLIQGLINFYYFSYYSQLDKYKMIESKDYLATITAVTTFGLGFFGLLLSAKVSHYGHECRVNWAHFNPKLHILLLCNFLLGALMVCVFNEIRYLYVSPISILTSLVNFGIMSSLIILSHYRSAFILSIPYICYFLYLVCGLVT